MLAAAAERKGSGENPFQQQTPLEGD